MSDQAEWMEPEDDEILELLSEDHIFEPSHIESEGVCRVQSPPIGAGNSPSTAY